jgi:HEAT repeat protein
MVLSKRQRAAVLCVITGVVAIMAAAWPARGADKAPNPDVLAEEAKKLVGQLGDDAFGVREAAAKRLAEIGRPAVPALREGLKSDDPEIRLRARRILDAIKSSVANLIEDLKDKDPAVRKEAAQELETMGAAAKEAVPALVAAVKDKDEDTRDAVIMALLAIDPDNKALTDAAPAKARVNGKYAKLLRRLKVPQDRQTYMDFNDYGQYPATDYAGYTKIPEGYWVYVYPYWYIWGEMKLLAK